MNVLLEVWQDGSNSVMTTTPSRNYSFEETKFLIEMLSGFSTLKWQYPIILRKPQAAQPHIV